MEVSFLQKQIILTKKAWKKQKRKCWHLHLHNFGKLLIARQKRSSFHFQIEYPEEGITLIIPRLGDKKKLLELSEKNVNFFKEELHAKKLLKLEDKTDSEKKAAATTIKN